MEVLHHFSEDDSIEVFEPHVPVTNPSQRPAVWAIDADHAPLYWFPRDCPRIAVWPFDRGDPAKGDLVDTDDRVDTGERGEFERAFATVAPRLHITEFGWLEAMASVSLFRYDFDATRFAPWPEATGQWVAHKTVEPIGCEFVGNLFELHRSVRIELRLVESLLPLVDRAVSDRWNFSVVRLANATPSDQ